MKGELRARANDASGKAAPERLGELRKARVARVVGVTAPVTAAGIEAEIVAVMAAARENRTSTKLCAMGSPDVPRSQAIAAQVVP
jgi:hypothetical protein